MPQVGAKVLCGILVIGQVNGRTPHSKPFKYTAAASILPKVDSEVSPLPSYRAGRKAKRSPNLSYESLTLETQKPKGVENIARTTNQS